jgi:betaine-aldehyde dehydrogenase
MGPLISQSQLERVATYAEIGKQDSELVTGGYRMTNGSLGNGYFFAPTIFDDAPPESPIVQEEIFGPVLAIQTFESIDEAVAIANGTRYGLAAGVWSRNIDRAMYLARRIRAGTVWINSYNVLAPEVETGGFRESGIGRASGLEGLHDFTEIKHIYIAVQPHAQSA